MKFNDQRRQLGKGIPQGAEEVAEFRHYVYISVAAPKAPQKF